MECIKRKMLFLMMSLIMVFAPISNIFVQSVNAQDEVTITYGIWDSKQEPGLREIADDFEAKNPGIKIEIQVTGWDDYWTMLEAAGTGGSLPDLFWMHSNEIYKYGSNDMLYNLDEYIKERDIDLANYPEELVGIFNVNDVQYGIPKDYDTVGLWYNKTMFDEADLDYPDESWTWDDLYEAAEVLTKDDGSQYGVTFDLVNQEGFYNFVYQNGGTILTEDNKSGYDLPKTIEGIDFYFSFVNNGLSPRTYNDGESRQLLENGIAAMGMRGSWHLAAFEENDYLKENFDVAVLPAGRDGTRAVIYNGLANVVDAKTDHPEEALAFLEYLSSEEAQTKAAELGVAISAYKGTGEKWVTSSEHFNLQAFVDMVEYAVIRPYTNNTTIWEERAYESLRPAYLGEKSTEEVSKAFAEVMNELISLE